jgi:hypothetical protein
MAWVDLQWAQQDDLASFRYHHPGIEPYGQQAEQKGMHVQVEPAWSQQGPHLAQMLKLEAHQQLSSGCAARSALHCAEELRAPAGQGTP